MVLKQSTDGLSWTNASILPISGETGTSNYVNGLIQGTNSLDGSFGILDSAYANNTWGAVSNNGVLLSSRKDLNGVNNFQTFYNTLGSKFTSHNVGASSTINTVAYISTGITYKHFVSTAGQIYTRYAPNGFPVDTTDIWDIVLDTDVTGYSAMYALVNGTDLYNQPWVVAAGSGGKIFTTTWAEPGATWTQQTSPTVSIISAGAAVDIYKYVYLWALGSLNIIKSDGHYFFSTWTTVSAMMINGIYSMAVDQPTGIVVTGGNGQMRRSDNGGYSWTTVTHAMGAQVIRSIAVGNVNGQKKWVAVGSNGAASSSTDGITWVTRSLGISGGTTAAVSYCSADNGSFSVVYNGNNIYLSTDGESWRQIGSSASGDIAALNLVVGDPGGFLYGGNLGQVIHTQESSAVSSAVGIANVDDNFVITSEHAIGRSPDLSSYRESNITWVSQETRLRSSTARAIAYGNGLWVAGDDLGRVQLSTDSITWGTLVTANSGSQAINSIKYGNGVFVAGGSVASAVAVSTNGTTWTSVNNSFLGGSYTYAIEYGNGIFMAVGAGGQLAKSTDGTTWTSLTSGVVTQLNAIKYHSGIWMIGGTSTVLRKSTDDGASWTPLYIGTLPNGVSVNGTINAIECMPAPGVARRWFIGGAGSGSISWYIAQSSTDDGQNWTSIPSLRVASGTIYSMATDGGNLIIVTYGAGQGVRVSIDGGETFYRDTTSFERGAYIYGAAYGDRRFVTVSSSSFRRHVHTSLYGFATPWITGYNVYLTKSVKQVNGKYIILARSTYFPFLPYLEWDGDTWQQREFVVSGFNYLGWIVGIDYRDGKYIIFDNKGHAYESTDFTTWTAITGLPLSYVNSDTFSDIVTT